MTNNHPILTFLSSSIEGEFFGIIQTTNRLISFNHQRKFKAKVVADIIKQLEVNYEHKIKLLEQQIKAKEEAHQKQGENVETLYKKEILLLKDQLLGTREQYEARIKHLRNQQPEKADTTLYWFLIIAACIIGVFLGKGCH